MIKRLNPRGDTIVEVLIAIAIVGSVLAGAYASSNRSLQATRRSQERAEALRVAEKQLEALKRAATVEGTTIFTGGQHFCIDDSETVRTFNGSPPAAYTADNYSLMPSGNYPTQCRTSYNNGSYYYFAWIDRVSTDTFLVRARWNGTGGLKQEVTISYRVHQ